MKTLLAALLLLSTAAAAHTEAWQRKYLLASRNSGGTYSLPNAPVVTGTTITSSWANTTLADLSTEITNSLDRSGRGAMTGPLRLAHGASAAVPDLAWDVETNSGFYRAALNDIRFSLAGVDLWQFGAGFVNLFGTLNITGLGVTVSGSTSSIPLQVFQAALANGNNMTAVMGVSNTVNNAAVFSYNKNATAALSAACVGVAGATGLCQDGNGRATTTSLLVSSSITANTVTASTNLTAGTVTANTGLTIGSVNGTAISASPRGTLVVGSGGISPSTCVAQNITTTGAVAGGECAIGYTTAVPVGLATYCQVSSNVCSLITCNVTAGVLTAPANTLSCRVFNP